MTRFTRKCGILCLCAVVLLFALSPVLEQMDAFADARKVGILTLPVSVAVIEESAFEGTAATEVVLPQEISFIAGRAFAGMLALQKINLPESLDYIGNDAFLGDDSVTIYGISGGKAEEYARRNGLPFQRPDAILPSEQEDMSRVKRVIVFFAFAQVLVFILHARFTGRRPGETRSICRKERIELHPLDLCFP